MNEEDVHHHPPLAAASEPNSCASLGRQTSWEYRSLDQRGCGIAQRPEGRGVGQNGERLLRQGV